MTSGFREIPWRNAWPVLVKARGAAADGLVRARSLLSRCRRAAQDSPADRRFLLRRPGDRRTRTPRHGGSVLAEVGAAQRHQKIYANGRLDDQQPLPPVRQRLPVVPQADSWLSRVAQVVLRLAPAAPSTCERGEVACGAG